MKKVLTLIIIASIAGFFTSCTKREKPPDNNLPPHVIPEEKTDNNIIKKSTADTILEKMSLEEKIGQLLIFGFNREIKDEELKSFSENYKIGGYLLFKRNFNDFSELYHLNLKLKAMNEDNPLPLFISIDEEGGAVSRLPIQGEKMPNPAFFGNLNDINITKKSGEIIGKQLYASGINVNLAPVLDILGPNNELLKLRSYGKTAEIVSAHGAAFADGISSQRVMPVAKHFPGHGDTDRDSHNTLPVINVDYTTLIKRELMPFKNAINRGLNAVMVGHIAFPNIDSSGKPATRSKIIINDLLREELGFNGIVLTDDIEMKAFFSDSQSFEQSIWEAFNAGVDIFIVAHTNKLQIQTINALIDGVHNDFITKERLDESVIRIIKAKLKYNLTDKMNMDFDDAYALFTDEEYVKFIKDIKHN